MHKDLVSVIVPVYNVEKYLSECLDSIVGQTYHNLEIICVDDGSSDNSLKVLEKYSNRDSRIKVLIQKNHGVSSARNKALDICSGDFIIMVDSDDTIDLDLVKKCLSLIKEYDVDGVYFNSSRFDHKGHTWNVYEGLPYVPEVSQIIDIQTSSFSSTWTNAPWVMYKHSIIKQNKLRFIDGLYYEDWEFVTKYTMNCKKIYWDKTPYYHYRCNFKSITTTVSEHFLDMFKSYNIVRKRYIDAQIWNLHKFISLRKILDYSLSTFLDRVNGTPLKNAYIHEIYNVMHQEEQTDIIDVINSFDEEHKKLFNFIYNKNFNKVYQVRIPKIFYKLSAHKNFRNMKEAYFEQKYKDMFIHFMKLIFKVMTRFYRVFTR